MNQYENFSWVFNRKVKNRVFDSSLMKISNELFYRKQSKIMNAIVYLLIDEIGIKLLKTLLSGRKLKIQKRKVGSFDS